jgi:hypothetical protein
MDTHGWKQLRDELRLEMHLAGMELKERREKLEPKVLEAERHALALEETGRWLLEVLALHLRALRQEVRAHFGPGTPPQA